MIFFQWWVLQILNKEKLLWTKIIVINKAFKSVNEKIVNIRSNVNTSLVKKKK